MASLGNLSELHRVKMHKNPVHIRSGLGAYGRAMRKYSFKPTMPGPLIVVDELVEQASHPFRHLFQAAQPHHVVHRRLVRKDSSGNTQNVSADDVQNDAQYLCTIKIGTPPQSVTVDMDTGSSDLWVWSDELSKKLQAEGKETGHHIFNHAKSSTFQMSPRQTWCITYGDGSSASGNVGTDTVCVGGVTVHNQAVELCTKMSEQFQKGTGDGLFGLAWPSINTVQPTPVQTPVANMISQSDIQPDQELFTAYLASYRNPDEQSFYTFGYMDQDVLAAAGSPIFYTKVDKSNGFWQFPCSSFSVAGTSHSLPGNTAIADTGTSLLLADDHTCKTIYAAIPGSKYSSADQGYLIPTATPAAALPLIQFDVGGQLFAINPEDLAYADMGNGMSYGGIQSCGDLPFFILGDVFLKAIYAIFDQGNCRFGCVQRVNQHSSQPSSQPQNKMATQDHATANPPPPASSGQAPPPLNPTPVPPNSPAPNTPIPSAPAPSAPAANAPVPSGPTPSAPAANAPAPNGPASGAPAPSAPAANAPAPSGPTPSAPAPSAQAPANSAPSGPASPGSSAPSAPPPSGPPAAAANPASPASTAPPTSKPAST